MKSLPLWNPELVWKKDRQTSSYGAECPGVECKVRAMQKHPGVGGGVVVGGAEDVVQGVCWGKCHGL